MANFFIFGGVTYLLGKIPFTPQKSTLAMFSVVDLPAFQAIFGPSKGTKTKGSNQETPRRGRKYRLNASHVASCTGAGDQKKHLRSPQRLWKMQVLCLKDMGYEP